MALLYIQLRLRVLKGTKMNKIWAHPLQVPSLDDSEGTYTKQAAKHSGADCSPGALGATGHSEKTSHQRVI